MKRFHPFIFAFFIMLLFQNCSTSGRAKTADTAFLPELLAKHPEQFDSLISKKEELGIQVIYTRIDRRKNGRPVLQDHYFNIDPEKYFYPASTVKLPVALLALQRLHELRIDGLGRNTTMITEAANDTQTIVYNDPTAPDGRPSIAHYIRKILLVSDNDAFNRLYEFLGQEYINDRLHAMGFDSAQIMHRLSLPLTEEQNRFTNPVFFMDSAGTKLYDQQAAESKFIFVARDTRMGRGYLQDRRMVNEPFDFSRKNRLGLIDLHSIMKSVIFPQSVPRKQRFHISKDDYQFLYRYLGMFPRESGFSCYETGEYPDRFAKMFLFSPKGDCNLRIFSKAGWAYGFLTDAAYIIDTKNNVEFLLSATIYCNRDGVFNDDRYDYESIGYPFLRQLAQAIYEYELDRPRQHQPDLSGFLFDYLSGNANTH